MISASIARVNAAQNGRIEVGTVRFDASGSFSRTGGGR